MVVEQFFPYPSFLAQCSSELSAICGRSLSAVDGTRTSILPPRSCFATRASHLNRQACYFNLKWRHQADYLFPILWGAITQLFHTARSCLISAIRAAPMTVRMGRLKQVSAILGAEVRAITEWPEEGLGPMTGSMALCSTGICSCRAELRLDGEAKQIDVRWPSFRVLMCKPSLLRTQSESLLRLTGLAR